MVNTRHSKQTLSDGIHSIVAYSYANSTARLAATGFTADDIYKIAIDLDTYQLFILINDSPITWFDVGNAAGSGDVVGPGSATDNALVRFDGTTGKLIQNSVATVDDSGNLALSGTVDGRDVAADGTKLDGIAMGATNTPLSNTDPINITKSTAQEGTATEASRQDHKHDISTTTPGAITPGDTLLEGSSTSLARADHQHSLPDFGSSSGTFCEGDDSRLTDDRTADGLRTDTTIVSISSADAPSAGQILRATGSTSATWQDEYGNNIYDAIVATSGGDYTSLYDAINDGANSVFVRTGFYIETNTITLPTDGIIITGEGGSVINFIGTARLELDASGGINETAGTISVTTNSTTVTGSGTSFTNLSAGDYIEIGDTWVKIDSISSNTSLEIVNAWQGNNKSGLSYLAQSLSAGMGLTLMTFLGGNNGCAFIRAVRGISISNCVFDSSASGSGLTIEDSSDIQIQQSFISNNSEGCVIDNCTQVTFDGACVFENNNSDGLFINDSNSIKISNSSTTNNDGDGISIEGSSNTVLINNVTFRYNNNKGINTESTTSNTTINSCLCSHNNDWGIDYDGSSNIIFNSIISNNDSGGIQGGDSAVIGSCNIFNNAGPGLNILSGDDNNIISLNHIYDNTGNGITLQADNNRFSSNIVTGNGGDGVNISSGSNNNYFFNNEFSGNTGTDFNNSSVNSIVNDYPTIYFTADTFSDPINSDWAINELAPTNVDSNNNGLLVRSFDDATEEGIGFTIEIPYGATNIVFKLLSRAETSPGSAQTVALTIYERGLPDNTSVNSWSSAFQLTDINIPTNENWQVDIQHIEISDLGLTNGQIHQFELTRDTADAGDTLTGDWVLHSLKVSFE